MTLAKIFRAALHRLEKLCNTVYYAFCDKRKIMVVNAYVFQLFGKYFKNNIGDDLNAVLAQRLSGKKMLAYRSFYHFGKPVDNLMAIGSVLGWMEDKNTTVWGAGILASANGNPAKNHSVGKVCAVRGKKTRECLLDAGIPCPEVYGDPALLMPLLYRPRTSVVKGRIGIIPHYVDSGNENVSRLLKELGDDGVLIKVRGYGSWQEFIDLICSCEFIISSSLHGLILADAYHIPNRWVQFSDLIFGGSFKFEDYYSSVGKTATPLPINGNTSIKDVIQASLPYEEIDYDPLPLLKAYPYEITDPEIRSLI